MERNYVAYSDRDSSRRNLQEHMKYIEDVNMYAKQVGHHFSYHMGVHERHLTASPYRKWTPEEFVDQEVVSAHTRRLQTANSSSNSTISSSGSSEYWNWCDSDNSVGHTVCSPVKSQKSCGSCWSFVAADAIETAVVIATNASAAVSLSPQQFLTWMQSEIKWESQNDGCNGGMTHGAFMDAAQNGWGLVTELTMPYDDSSSGSSSASNSSSVCTVSADEAAASITGWEQIVEYAGGFYNCPNNGVMASKNDLNHALLLVGYGTDSSVGDYWILKNSYGSSWGDSGFIKLVADAKINCGLNVFPVIPTGAKAGAQASTTIDSGGDKIFVGLSPTAWIGVAAATTIFTLVTTAIGVGVSQRKLKVLRKQNSAMYAAQPQYGN
ncbi:Cysteine protease [Phytophthora megakarya]|uniref:Cysteine protease n=1 Tax=Phytophthora megakarya TaxID=4795 RepID=A0A225X4Y5_9STRA|nr:Cysteine protease [Phytophthora megakarya]